MGEDARLFINQGIRIMAGDKPVGFAKEGMLTCSIEDDGSTKDGGAWERPMRHSYEIKGETVVDEVGDSIRELLEGAPRKVYVEIRHEMGKIPRKIKKALRIANLYRRDTKWKRKAKRIAYFFAVLAQLWEGFNPKQYSSSELMMMVVNQMSPNFFDPYMGGGTMTWTETEQFADDLVAVIVRVAENLGYKGWTTERVRQGIAEVIVSRKKNNNS